MIYKLDEREGALVAKVRVAVEYYHDGGDPAIKLVDTDEAMQLLLKILDAEVAYAIGRPYSSELSAKEAFAAITGEYR